MATPVNSASSVSDLLLQVVQTVNQLQSDSSRVTSADSMTRQGAILAEHRRSFEPYNTRSRPTGRNNHAGVPTSIS